MNRLSFLVFVPEPKPESRTKMKFSGQQVAAARELLGITQSELATAAGLTLLTISRFERGEVGPRRDTVRKIGDELQRRGIEFTNGEGMGVRLHYAKAAEYARTSSQTRKEADH